MTGRKLRALVGVIALCMLLATWPAGAAPAGANPPVPPGPGQPASPGRERSEAPPAAPNISFIDSPTATCESLEPSANACLINWNSLAVTASTGHYIITMTVAIDNQIVAVNTGFFQTSMYVPSTMYDEGFRVPCGPPGSAGYPTLGGTHSWTVRAGETGGLTAANYGAVICPIGSQHKYLPTLHRNS